MNQSPVQLRNAAARRLMARRRFREALDVLNEAIRADPRFAESYDNRAAVFEALGMNPQAEADRRKVVELGGVKLPPPEVAPVQVAKPKQRPKQLKVRYPAAPRPRGERSGGAAAMRLTGTVLVTLGLLLAAGIGIYVALTAITDALNGDDSNAVAQLSPTPSGDASGSPSASDDATITGTPTPVPEPVNEALTGSPLSFSDAKSAWEAKGLTVTAGDPSTEVTGFATTAVDVTLSRAGATMKVAVLFYDDPSLLSVDWSVGDTVVPKTGHKPDGPSPWADRNAVVVMIEDDPTLHADARDAFLGIS